MTEENSGVYSFECPKCGHRWKVSVKELAILSLATGKAPRCPKCQSGRVFFKKGEG